MDPEIIEETEMFEKDIADENKVSEFIDEEKRLNFYVQRLKLAAAVAVIRATPQEMTPETYASYLIQCFKEDNSKWKNKCETLERDIIVLEQKLQTIALKEKFNIPDMNINLMPSENPLDRIAQSCVPPSSDLRTKISCTIEFVRSFILLGSISHENFEKNKEQEELRKTVLQSVSLLFEYLRSYEGLSMEFEVIKCAMDEVHRLFDSKANFFEKDLVKLMLLFVENLLLDIYKTLEINMVQYQHRRSALIQMLAEQKKLTALILSRLLREITILSDSLATVFESQVEDITPLLRVENAYYVLQATEGTLHFMRQHKSPLNVLRIPKALLVEWSKTTEKSLLDIGSHLPMYCIYVWHVKTLLKSVLDSKNEN